MRLFKRRQYIKLPAQGELQRRRDQVPADLWQQCPICQKTCYTKELTTFNVCPHCQYGFRLTARARLQQLTATFQEWDATLASTDPLKFPGYATKLAQAQKSTQLNDSVLTGYARLGQQACALGIMDAHFMMGSMGTVTGEKITRLFERATQARLAVVLFTASGGARMQEGIHSLMQMTKVSQAVAAHSAAGLLYITVLTDPTTGGVTASFAMQGDIILAEPHALVGFAGRRVIEQTINAQLPADFQRAEQVQQAGFIDRIVPRAQMKTTLQRLLQLHEVGGGAHQAR
ncbi:acetyl-CoA carboxylase, carboxyltransferase subunit beta [Loigolactobacillus jiayinensis]|uniref:Acetyl-coenzyme A carboxylase carboxyl transferase subunit beta n=1 Tax=Loigolactobacillus jiayinensis TaxID=2486016 RepID=A0ABW1R989_9LACO|nr:acetyl-CoA carboxylase, carboxyltransferase subunit beta [Loigolactobacillus jiayinensis]